MQETFKNRKALIVGGGISGPVLAMFLKEVGIEPVVYEARPEAMVIEIIRYDIAVGHEGAFEEAYAQAGRHLGRSPNCLGYQVTRCVEEPNRYIVRIEWDSLDGHLQGFRESPEFRDFFAPVRPHFDAIQEMHRYQETEDSYRG